MDGSNACLLYAAVGGYPSRTSASGVQIGLATINLCTDQLLYFTNLTAFARGSMGNDLTKVGDTIYVTDFLGGQLLSVTGQNTPTPSIAKVMDFAGANGIEHVDEHTLIISSITGSSGTPGRGLDTSQRSSDSRAKRGERSCSPTSTSHQCLGQCTASGHLTLPWPLLGYRQMFAATSCSSHVMLVSSLWPNKH